MSKRGAASNFPVLVTIFSAPNYCDAYKNQGAIIKYEKDNFNIRQFRESPHPFWLPNFQDVISWSLPFALERVTDFMKAIWSLSSKEEREADKQKAERNNRIKAKMLAVGKVANVLSEMREANENAVELKGLAPTPNDETNTPRALRAALRSERKRINSFDEAKEFDQVNEKRPDVNSAN
jgi:serine/threonine-protein phosphatase 2B catalytic subunit